MKSKTISHIILEGCDGVGKDTICSRLWPRYKFKYRVYVRGEISDYVYSLKYNRRFISTQRGLPFLYVVLIGDKEEIKNHIIKRDGKMSEDLTKISDNELFKEASIKLINDYHIIVIDCGKKSIDDLVNEIYTKSLEYIDSLEKDDEINIFNKLYQDGCKKVGINFSVRNNQPYFNNTMIMADAHLHNGSFETFTNLSIPHNLIFSLAYTFPKSHFTRNDFYERQFDFSYLINSKILFRPEVYDYYGYWESNHKKFLVTESRFIPCYENSVRVNKEYGDDYINILKTSRATVYTSRDLVSIKMMTVRVYEAIISGQLLFVDINSDPDNEILSQMFDKNKEYDKKCINLLRVTPNTITTNYNKIINEDMKCPEQSIINYILEKQYTWYYTRYKNIHKYLDKNL